MAEQGFVYFLVDPRFPRWPRYVGVTADIEQRRYSHTKATHTGNEAIREWKRRLRSEGIAPELVPFRAFGSLDEAKAYEWRLQRRWRRRGLADLNSARDGAVEQFGLHMAGLRRSRERRGVA